MHCKVSLIYDKAPTNILVMTDMALNTVRLPLCLVQYANEAPGAEGINFCFNPVYDAPFNSDDERCFDISWTEIIILPSSRPRS